MGILPLGFAHKVISGSKLLAMLTQGHEGEGFLSDVQITYPGSIYIQYQICKIRWHRYDEGVKATIVLWRTNVLQNGLQGWLVSPEKP